MYFSPIMLTDAPRLQCLYDQRLTRTDGTIAFILAPTRELATQIFGVATNLLKPFHWLLCTSITGGERRKAEVRVARIVL
jgi:ATP-dependent RNA helicase DDX31/DBP7